MATRLNCINVEYRCWTYVNPCSPALRSHLSFSGDVVSSTMKSLKGPCSIAFVKRFLRAI